MENKTPQTKRTAYTSRFAGSTDGTARRTAAAARARAAGAQGEHRPSGFAPVQKKRTAAKPASSKAAAKSKKPEKQEKQKPLHNKRTQSKPSFAPWLKALLIGIPALIVLFVIFVLIFGGGGGTYHQLPKVERIESESFSPAGTSVPAEANAFDTFDESAFEGSLFDESAFDASGDFENFLGGEGDFSDLGELGDLEDFDGAFDFGDAGDLEDFNGEFGFGDAGNSDDDALMQQFIASERAGT